MTGVTYQAPSLGSLYTEATSSSEVAQISKTKSAPSRELIGDGLLILAGHVLLILAIVVMALPSADTSRAPLEAKTEIRKSVIEEPLPAIAVTPTIEPTEPPVTIQREVVYVQELSANVRDAPSLSGKLVGTQPPGTRLTVFQRQRGWVEVGQEEPIGWIGLRMLAFSPPTQAVAQRNLRSPPSRSDASDMPTTTYVGPQGKVTFGVPFSFDEAPD